MHFELLIKKPIQHTYIKMYVLIFQHTPCLPKLLNHHVTKVSACLGSLLNGKGRRPPWSDLAVFHHLLGTFCARTRRYWPFIIEAMFSKVSPDSKPCNWCGWSCWIPGPRQLRRVFAVSFHCLMDGRSTQATWSVSLTSQGEKNSQTE